MGSSKWQIVFMKCVKLENMCILWFCSTLQVFDSNVNKDKLLRLKLGSGKVIKVELLALSL